MNATIEALAREKTFQQLTATERAAVLAEMPETAYAQLRQILSAAPALDADQVAPPALKGRLLQRFPPHPSPWDYRIPLWQAAATLLLVSGIFWLLRSEKIQPSPVIQVKTQTIYRDSIQVVEHIRTRYRTVYQLQTDTVYIPVSAPVVAKQDVAQEGHSLKDEPELMRFFVRPR